MAAPIPYLRLRAPLVLFIPVCALMGLSSLLPLFSDLGIFTCFILYASIYGIGPFVYSWTLDLWVSLESIPRIPYDVIHCMR